MAIKIRKSGQWVNVATASLGTGITKLAQLWDQKTKGTNGGTFTSGAWRDRTLNTENDPQSFVTLESGNVSFSLLSGTYRIAWSAPAYNVDMHKTQLVYSTNSDFSAPVTTIQGSSEFDSETISTNSQTRSFGDTQLTITEKTYFKIQHRSHDTQADWGLGSAANFPDAPEIYTQVSIEDLNTAAGAGGGGGGGGVTDGDKGDITVTNSGATWTIDNDVIEEKHINADGSPSNGKVLEYYSGHSTNWRWADPGATVTTSDSAPATPSAGDLWWNSSTGILNVYYTDADSSQWVNATGRAGGAVAQGKTKVAVLRDQKNYDKGGGYFYGDYWRDRDLTVIEDPQSFVTFVPTANGQTTESVGKTPGYWSLPAGTYEIQWGAFGGDVNRHQTRLVWSTTQSDITWTTQESTYNTWTADNPPDETSRFGTNECFGSSENVTLSTVDAWTGTWSKGTKVITITETTWFKLLHISGRDDAEGFGTPVDSSAFSPDRYTTGKNIYAEVRIVDLATAIKNTGDDYVAGTSKIATVKDVKAYDANGGTFAAATWVHRTLNTLSDPQTIGLSISGNIVTVPAGTYSMRWRAPAYLCNRFTSRLAYSSTSATVASGITYVDGTTGYSHQSDGKSVEESFGDIASITFSATTYLKIEQYSATGYTAQVSGLGVSSGISGVDSVFTTLEIEDLATAVKKSSGTDGNTISVKDYGAVGDGATDDTASIQSAINATSAAKQRLYIPAGTYIVSGLSLLNNTYLFGVGTLKRKASTSNYVITASGKNNFILKGFTIDGNKSAATDEKAAVFIDGGYQVVIDGITVTNHIWHGIGIRDTTDRTQKTESYIKNCTVSNSDEYGIEAQDVKDLTIIGNLISNVTSTGILIFGTAADKTDLVTVEGNTVIDAGGAGISAPYFYTDPDAPYPVGYFGVSKVQIIDNKVKSSGNNGIVVQTNNGIVSNNICDDNGTGTGHQGILINAHYITVDGNSSINNKGVGIDVGDGKFVTVTNNIVNSNAQIGIEINSCESCVVDGNILRNNWTGAGSDEKIRAGILVQEDTGQFIGGCKDITVSNNDVKGGTNQAYGISVLNPYGARVGDTDPTNRVSIIGNSITGSGSGTARASLTTRGLYIEVDNGHFICEKNIDPPADIVSASTIKVDQNTNFQIVTGTTTITSIDTDTGKYQRGRMLTILFTGALQVTDGSNLKLNGNLAATNGTILTLVAEDGYWYEVSRSINS